MVKYLLPVIIILFCCSYFPAQTVYVTKSGTKYHTSICSNLSGSKSEISLLEAQRKGYSPCKRCMPTSETKSFYNIALGSNQSSLHSKSTANKGQCQARTKKGKQCKRKAVKGSNYCYQHI